MDQVHCFLFFIHVEAIEAIQGYVMSASLVVYFGLQIKKHPIFGFYRTLNFLNVQSTCINTYRVQSTEIVVVWFGLYCS